MNDGPTPNPEQAGDAPMIVTRALTRTYLVGSGRQAQAVHALRGVDMRVRRGESVVLMGASGSGKSTLMHLLGCLDTPTSGEYLLEGRDVADLSESERADVRNRRIGFVFQDFNLLPQLSALENVALPLLYRRGPNRGIWGGGAAGRERAMAELENVGLADRARHRPTELSGGERQRVAIARALAADPAIVLADEPTGNLDSSTGAEIMGLLAELHRMGRTLIVVTHDESVAAYTSRTLIMRDGELVSESGLQAVARPATAPEEGGA